MGKAVLSSMQYFFTCLWPSCCLALILTKEGGEKELSKHSWLESVGGGRRKHISVTARSVSFYWRMTIQSHGACKKYIHRVVHWHFLQSQPTYFVREMCISWSLFLVHTVEVLACKHIPIIYICKFFCGQLVWYLIMKCMELFSCVCKMEEGGMEDVSPREFCVYTFYVALHIYTLL